MANRFLSSLVLTNNPQNSRPGRDAACNAASQSRDVPLRKQKLMDPGSATHHAAAAARCAASGERKARIIFPFNFCTVIPGRCEASSPESRGSGSGPADHPGTTAENIPPSRGAICTRVIESDLVPRKTEGAGNAGCLAAPAVSRAKNKKHTSVVTASLPKQSGIPRAMVLRFPSCSPRRPGFFASVPRVMRSIIARLISASGYQAHTTSPSAASSLVS